MNRLSINRIAVCMTLMAFTPLAVASEEDDFVVGRTAEGTLAVEFDPAEVFFLEPVDGFIQGYALDDPGFLSLQKDEPDEDLFALDASAVIEMEILALDPAFQIWTPGFTDLLDSPGDGLVIGSPFFDEHPTYHIDTADPAFDPDQSEWQVTFRLIDTGSTEYGPTGELTATFAPVPEPATLLLLGAGAAACAAQRRTRRPRSR